MITTFKYSEFFPPEKSVALKKASGARISVVIPTINEEDTIGDVVASVRSLMDPISFVDELVVMDCSSFDATASIARKGGAQIYDLKDVRPDISESGKGVALWKSQFVTDGDIVIYIDADIRDFDTRFILGLGGALLENEHLKIVKAAYRRPLFCVDQKVDDSGGRVTELFIRPLLNLFLPEMADIRQPLAGEYALRRECIEKIPFFSGYGVDIGLLLEHYFTWGAESIGQVDMDERIHRNKNLQELSKMSFELGGVFFGMLQKKGLLQMNREYSSDFKIWETDRWNEYTLRNSILSPKNGGTAV